MSNTKNVKIAVVEPVFTTTAYSSFYEFYRLYSSVQQNTSIKTDLQLLNATVSNGWGVSYNLYFFMLSDTAKEAGIIVGKNMFFITDIDRGKIFTPKALLSMT